MKNELATARIAELRTSANNIAQFELSEAQELINDSSSAAHHLHIETLEFLTLFRALADFNSFNDSILFFLQQATDRYIKSNPAAAGDALDYYSMLMRLLHVIAFERSFIDKKLRQFDILSDETEIFEQLKEDEIASA